MRIEVGGTLKGLRGSLIILKVPTIGTRFIHITRTSTVQTQHSTSQPPLVSRAVEERRNVLSDLEKLSSSSHGNGRTKATDTHRPATPIDLRGSGASTPSIGFVRRIQQQQPPRHNRDDGMRRPRMRTATRESNLSSRTPVGPRTSRVKRSRFSAPAGSRADVWKEMEELTTAEAEYTQAQKEESTRHTEHTLKPFDVQQLQGLGPSLPVGGYGSLETLRRRIRDAASSPTSQGEVRTHQLAQDLLRGNLVNFADEAEMTKVLIVAQKLTKATSDRRAEETGALVELSEPRFESLNQEQRAFWEQLLLLGRYNRHTNVQSSDSVAKVVQMIRQNGSYSTFREAKFVKKLNNLAPATKPPPNAQGILSTARNAKK